MTISSTTTTTHGVSSHSLPHVCKLKSPSCFTLNSAFHDTKLTIAHVFTLHPTHSPHKDFFFFCFTRVFPRFLIKQFVPTQLATGNVQTQSQSSKLIK